MQRNFRKIRLDSDYEEILESLADNGIRGGATYDALIAHAAFKAQVDKLLTFNTNLYLLFLNSQKPSYSRKDPDFCSKNEGDGLAHFEHFLIFIKQA
ncbi:MAG: hypothetical protein ACE5IW_04235 [bacterium]